MRNHRDDSHSKKADLGNREQVRRLNRAQDRNASLVVRCQQCGNQQLAEAAMVGPLSECPRCSTALHSCKHCKHFDTRARFQCKKPVSEAIGDKWKGNSCDLFEARLVLDSTGKRLHGKGKKNAKNAFDALFKD